MAQFCIYGDGQGEFHVFLFTEFQEGRAGVTSRRNPIRL
jgi:hypothetical protein